MSSFVPDRDVLFHIDGIRVVGVAAGRDRDASPGVVGGWFVGRPLPLCGLGLLHALVNAFLVVEGGGRLALRSEEHTSELQSRGHLVCRLLLEKKKRNRHSPNAGNRRGA